MIKYRGGKTKEIPFFQDYFPANFDTYIEPFFGGGAVYFHICPQHAIINDINRGVINFYTDVRDNYDIMREQLNILEELYIANQHKFMEEKKKNPDLRIDNKNEQLYYQIRDMLNGKVPRAYLESVIYFFINKTAYSGMIRFNAEGDYNVPFGRYQNLNTHLITQEHSQLLQGANILCEDFAQTFTRVHENDFMFLDPPYDCIFNDYGNLEMANGFDENQHRRLATLFRQLNCRTLMVIGKTPLIEELYDGFIREEYFKSYSVNIRNRFKSESKHLIITNY